MTLYIPLGKPKIRPETHAMPYFPKVRITGSGVISVKSSERAKTEEFKRNGELIKEYYQILMEES